ncbi:hypothetical protein GCM10009682_46180 [Luedemannella flava]|uniref:DUF768 domain-containing protein n=1 Tax=Luedemannella flava TaxID=349316 RepID=A0ABP4YQ84_9ACTN
MNDLYHKVWCESLLSLTSSDEIDETADTLRRVADDLEDLPEKKIEDAINVDAVDVMHALEQPARMADNEVETDR